MDGGPEQEVLRIVQEHAAELLRFAQRFSICADDAHDAYQRGIEILLRRMRTDPPRFPVQWLRTVIKHEALTVRAKREELVGRKEFAADDQEARHLEDPSERAAGAERLWHTAEAMQRLKPQEITALLQRAEGYSYHEIAERNAWSYTKVNRAVTEGRRALLERLGAIESGAECARWLSLLSALADGEATAADLAQLRPHLRACPACRATLRTFHDAPRQLAAIVPVALAGVGGAGNGGLGGHVEVVVHALLDRLGLAALRMQNTLDALPTTKFAAVAASGAALAGGGVALEHVARQVAAPHPVAQVQRSTPSDPGALAAHSIASRVRTVSGSLALAGGGPEWPSRAGARGPAEFALEAPSTGPPPAKSARASGRGGSPSAPVFAAPRTHAKRSPPAFAAPQPSPPGSAEFAGP